MLLRWFCSVVVLTVVVAEFNYIHKPHIVFIVADDLGWDDMSCHGSDQILTPNMDTLAYHGVELYQYYTDCDGTPSRSAMFTGKYPLRMGTQGPSIRVAEDRGIPVRERLLPNYLQELGYVTHLVGKWGVGKSRPHYHPCNRGFGDFCGFLGDAVDFFTYNAIEKCDSKTFYGLDFFHNFDAIENQSGHLTHVLTTKAVQVIRSHNTSVPLYLHLSHAATHTGGAMAELQPPADSIRENDHLAHPLRRLYAGSVTAFDKSIGHVIAALAEREILHNTLIVIVSDNGAPTVGPSQNFGSNYPLRGVKTTPWEGGVRSIGIVWHHQISPKIFEGLVHVTDWVPTLVTAAGGKVTEPIDGIDQWPNIHEGITKNKRNEILISIDESKGWAAYRENDFKIIVGDVERELSSHFGKDLKQLKGKSPNYDIALLECETVHVFKETLDLQTDLDAAYIKRQEFNLMQFSVEEPSMHICVPTRGKGCLFNISADPLEMQDLWHSSPDIVRQLTLRLRSYWAELRPRGLPYCDQRADPALRNYTWSPWIADDELKLEPFLMVPPFPLQVSIGEIQYLVDLNFNVFKSKVDSYIKIMGDAIVKSISGLFSV